MLLSMQEWRRIYKCEMCSQLLRELRTFEADMGNPIQQAARINEAHGTVLTHAHSEQEIAIGRFVGFQLASAAHDLKEAPDDPEKKILEQKLAISDLALRIERETLTRVRKELAEEIEKLRGENLRAYGLTPEEITALRAAQVEAGKLRSELEDLRAAEKFREENRLRPEEEGSDWQVEVTPEAFRNCLELAGAESKPEESKPEEAGFREMEAYFGKLLTGGRGQAGRGV